MAIDDKDTYVGEAVVFRVGAPPLSVMAQLRATRPRFITECGSSFFWSGWMGRLVATRPWGESAVGSMLWLRVRRGGDVGVTFVRSVLGPVAPVPDDVADMFRAQGRLLGLDPAGGVSRGFLEHRSVAWVDGGNSAPFGSTGMLGPPPAGDREPRRPHPTAPEAWTALELEHAPT